MPETPADTDTNVINPDYYYQDIPETNPDIYDVNNPDVFDVSNPKYPDTQVKINNIIK